MNKLEADITVASLTISAPLWVDALANKFLLYGGVILLVIRLAIAVRDWYKGRQK